MLTTLEVRYSCAMAAAALCASFSFRSMLFEGGMCMLRAILMLIVPLSNTALTLAAWQWHAFEEEIIAVGCM